VSAVHVPDYVHFLLAALRAVGALKLGVFAALPPHVVAQRALSLVIAIALRTRERARLVGPQRIEKGGRRGVQRRIGGVPRGLVVHLCKNSKNKTIIKRKINLK